MKIIQVIASWLAFTTTGWAAIAGVGEVTILTDARVAPAAFAAGEIEAALQARGERASQKTFDSAVQAGRRIVLAPVDDRQIARALNESGGTAAVHLDHEGFALRRTGEGGNATIWIIGAGPGGVMYGGLEVAEQIRLNGFEGVEPMERNPYFAMRGTKFNLPLDVRTPSYTDMSDAGQQNIGTVWDYEFWTKYLDALARDRYNFVSLWNLHPFPSMVKVPGYPDVALDDVQRSTGPWPENHSLNGIGYTSPEILREVETLKKISIDEKIEFWRRVMRYARDRNIGFYIVTWNVFTYGTNGKYGITDAMDNPVTIDYFRRSVKQMFATYPLLDGIGLTTGENMGQASFDEKENWAFATYGQGVLDAANAEPGRKFRLIHRQHQTRAQDIVRTFEPVIRQPNVDFVFSFKYAQAHALSSVTQPFYLGFVETLGDRKTLWTLRNDDNYLFRWGAPDFVRAFIRNIPRDVSLGFYYGSDQWVPGREFISREPAAPRQLEVEKHWYHSLLWGRLGYDPSLGNDRLMEILAQRFPHVSSPRLFKAWQDASMIYPLTTGFHWGELDFQWYIEACKSQPGPAETKTGFHDVNRFITLPPHPGTGTISIPNYVEAVTRGKKVAGPTPLEVADQIQRHADDALAAVAQMNAEENGELRQTLADIRAMALLGEYYARKIRGATELAFYRRTRAPFHQHRAIEQLQQAAEFWNQYTTLAAELYKNPLWTNRVGYVDWEKLNIEVARDIAIASEVQPPVADQP